MRIYRVSFVFALCYTVLSVVSGGRHNNNNNFHHHQHQLLQQASAQKVNCTHFIPSPRPRPVVGYNYPVPQQAVSSEIRPQQIIKIQPQTVHKQSSVIHQIQSASAQQQSVQKVSAPVSPAIQTQTQTTAATPEDEARSLQHIHMAQIQTIDVACGKERMTVRVMFDDVFNGIIYAKGHYNDPKCRFVNENTNQKMYQFEMMVGECGVQFIDSGLTNGGKAYVEGLLIVILEPGVQEAWDAARRIQCLWEGNIDQTVTFPLSINMLDSETLTFSGDTASANLEIQSGRGPRSNTVQGLVRIGDLLTAVVTVQGDSDFDLLVRNCVATDGTPNNKIVLSDSRGCATKPKLMGGWTKQKNPSNTVAFSYLSAFKFPDVMDLFLECTVSLCKGACEECPEFLELHVPTHGSTTAAEETSTEIDERARVKRSILNYNTTQGSRNNLEESLTLRRVVHVIGPGDLPELQVSNTPIYGNNCPNDCFSFIAILLSVAISLLLSMFTVILFGAFRRRARDGKF